MPIHPVRWALWAVIAVAAAAPARAQPAPQTAGVGVVLNAAPMYLYPDPSRTPLTTLAAGTTVRVLAREGDWDRVEYRDPYLGTRTGYVLASNIRLEPVAPRTGGAARPPQTQQPATTTPAEARAFDRGFISVNGSYQSETTAFAATTTFKQNVELGTANTAYAGTHPIVIDAAVGMHVWRMIDAAVAITWASQSHDAQITAAIPHPFVFNQPRSVSGAAQGIDRQELAAHFDAAVVVPPAGRVQVSIFGGPSVFHVKQGLVTAVAAIEQYPYDTATFGSASIADATQTHLGYNAGADVSVLLWKRFGVGAIVRYSRANMHFTPADGVDVTVKAGGLQAGGGVRFRF